MLDLYMGPRVSFSNTSSLVSPAQLTMDYDSPAAGIESVVQEIQRRNDNIGFTIGNELRSKYQWIYKRLYGDGLDAQYYSWDCRLANHFLHYSPLHRAVKNDDQAAIAYFIRQNPEYLNQQDDSGQTPLHYAVMDKNVPAIKALLEAKAELYERNNAGLSPMAIALNEPDHKLLRVLLALGFDPLKSTHQATLYFEADWRESILKLYPADFDLFGRLLKGEFNLLTLALMKSDETAVSDILNAIPLISPSVSQQYEDVIRTSQYPLLSASFFTNSKAIFKMLVQKGYSPNERIKFIKDGVSTETTPLLEAIQLGNHHAIEYLIALGADLNLKITVNGQQKAICEIGLSRYETLTAAFQQRLISHWLESLDDATINKELFVRTHQGQVTPMLPLALALRSGYRAHIEKCLALGADVNRPFDGCKNLIEYAKPMASQDVVELLMKSSQQQNPLHVAIINRDLEAVKQCADPLRYLNRYDNKGRSTLLLAIELDFPEAIEALVERGISLTHDQLALAQAVEQALNEHKYRSLQALGDINQYITFHIPKSGGQQLVSITPLVIAVINDNIAAIEYCLQAGADVSAIIESDGRVQTPLDVMLNSANSDIRELGFKHLPNIVRRNGSQNPIVGPNQKNAYTTLFEMLIREILKKEKSISVNPKANQYGHVFYNIVVDGYEYDMHKIITKMDWEQVRLTADDYRLHSGVEGSSANLSGKLEHLYDYDVSNIRQYFGCSLVVNAFLKGDITEFNANNRWWVRGEPLEWWVYSAFLTSTLNKIPPETEPQIICRGQSVSDTLKRLNHLSFISTSPNEGICSDYASGVKLIFSTPPGRDISALWLGGQHVIPPTTLGYTEYKGEENGNVLLMAYPNQPLDEVAELESGDDPAQLFRSNTSPK